MLKTKITYKSVLNFVISLAFSILLTFAKDGACFLALPFFIALLYLKVNPIFCVLVFIPCFLVKFNLTMALSSVISCALAIPLFLLFRRKGKRVGGKVLIIAVISIIPFAFFLRTELISVIVQSALSIVLTPVFISAVRVLYVKKLSFKSDDGEKVCLVTFLTFLGFGFISLFGFNAYRSIVLLALLFTMEIFDLKTACVLAVTLAIAPSIKSLSLNYFATYSLVFLLPSLFIKKSRLLSGFLTILADFACAYFLSAYGAFHYLDVLYSAVPVLLYLFTPQSTVNKVKLQAKALNERTLTKYAVNRLRSTVSGKLYDVSSVFYEMKKCLNELRLNSLMGEEFYSKLAGEVIKNACESCPNYLRCKNLNFPDENELVSIISVGLSKNRVSLVDLTKNFASNCGYVNSVIFEMNSLINKYHDRVQKNSELSKGKELILMQSGGISSVLKNIALDYSKTLSYEEGLEKTVSSALLKNGLQFVEIMAFNGDSGLELNLVISDDINLEKLIKVVSLSVGENMNVVSKTHLSLTHSAITMRPAPLLDAAFGLSSICKDGSPRSGDTHSLIKIDDARFLVALSDGMGSGNLAYQTSKTAVSLIESFYKAGLDGNLVINMVNKVLALGTEDSFSAIDVMSVNLFNLTADFIKVGSPHSYLLGSDSIRIIEGNSLPLGILDELSPTGVSVSLEEGSTVMLISDGVADAFGSSTDFISYLKGLRTKNPQTLADEVCSRALTLLDGKAKDDMTVICVRIFKKVS